MVVAIQPEPAEGFGAAGEDMMADLALVGGQPMGRTITVETTAHHRLQGGFNHDPRPARR